MSTSHRRRSRAVPNIDPPVDLALAASGRTDRFLAWPLPLPLDPTALHSMDSWAQAQPVAHVGTRRGAADWPPAIWRRIVPCLPSDDALDPPRGRRCLPSTPLRPHTPPPLVAAPGKHHLRDAATGDSRLVLAVRTHCLTFLHFVSTHSLQIRLGQHCRHDDVDGKVLPRTAIVGLFSPSMAQLARTFTSQRR